MHFSALQVEHGEVPARRIEIAVMLQKRRRHRRRPHSGAAEVVVAVAFDVRNAERAHDGEVLEQGDSGVAQVFTAEHAAVAVEQGQIQQALGDPFAVLVTRARVAGRQRAGQVVKTGVGLVYDEWRMLRPGGKGRGGFRSERTVPVQRLLHQQQPALQPCGERGARHPVIPVRANDRMSG